MTGYACETINNSTVDAKPPSTTSSRDCLHDIYRHHVRKGCHYIILDHVVAKCSPFGLQVAERADSKSRSPVVTECIFRYFYGNTSCHVLPTHRKDRNYSNCFLNSSYACPTVPSEDWLPPSRCHKAVKQQHLPPREEQALADYVHRKARSGYPVSVR
nr:hypothetical protein CFP56_32305 [Quercus suber]